MNTLVNKVQLIGSLGQDPEMKTFDNDRKMARFSVATHAFYKNASGERVEETTWHNVVAWGKTADILDKYVKKGDKVGVEGRLSNRSYEDSDGNKKYITEVVAHEILMLSPKKMD